MTREPSQDADPALIMSPVVARLLFLSANASDRGPLAVDLEYNRVKNGLQMLGVWPAWRGAMEHVPAAAWEQVAEQLLLHEASIVHFAGHGHPDGSLEFSTHNGGSRRVQADGLAELFAHHARQVRLVVLNACYSDALGIALTAHIDIVVGMRSAVPDGAAVTFALTFYQQLAGGRSVQTAFEVARAVLLGHASDAASWARDMKLFEPASEDSLPQLRVRAGIDASQLVFAPDRAQHSRSPTRSTTSGVRRSRRAAPGPDKHRLDIAPRARAEVPPSARTLLRDMHIRLLAGYAPDAIIYAAAVAELAIRVIVGRPLDGRARLGDLLDELRAGHADLARDAHWVEQRRAAAQRLAGQAREDLDDDARQAGQIATRLALHAGLIIEADSVACEREARRPASGRTSSALLRLDRATHRKVLDDRLEHSRRVLLLLIHGEIGQGHDHFGEIMSWRLRSGRLGRWREIVVNWPERSASIGLRLATLLEDLAKALEVKLPALAEDPTTADGARIWAPALASIVAAIDAQRAGLVVRHVVRCPARGVGGDDALVGAYVQAIWTTVTARPGERVVVGLDLRRIEVGGMPMTRSWRLSHAELKATRAIAAMLDRLQTSHTGTCITVPELTSVATADLIDWLRAEAARHRDEAELEAIELMSSTRGGRFDLVVQRLSALNLDRNRSIKW